MKTSQKSFAAGEITSELSGHIASAEYQTGLKECTNWLTLPHGPAMYRPGLEFQQYAADRDNPPRLIPFIPDEDDAYLVCLLGPGAIIQGPEGTAIDTSVTVSSTLVNMPTAPAFRGLQVPNASTQPNGFVWITSGIDIIKDQWFKTTLMSTDATYSYYMLTKPGYNIPFLSNFNQPGEDPATLDHTVNFQNVVLLNVGYSADELAQVHYAQSYDVLTLTHPTSYMVKITLTGGVWAAEYDTTTAQSGALLTSATWTPSVTSGGTDPTPQEFLYTETRVVGGDEIEVAKTQGVATIDPAGGVFGMAWGADPGANAATGFRLYFKKDGIFRVVVIGVPNYGSSTGYTLGSAWDNVAAAQNDTPPANRYWFPTFFPRAVGYFEQRKVFGGSPTNPQTLLFTKTGTEGNTQYSMPQQANDAMSLNLAALQRNTIEHIVPMSSLIVLTRSAIFSVAGGESGGIAPDNYSIRVRSYIGSGSAQPAVLNDAILYAASRGGHIFAMNFSQERGGQIAEDVCALAPHLFDGYTIRDMALQQAPYRILWVVRSDFKLLSMTYHPELKVIAWHQHEIDGDVHFVGVLPEGAEDRVYLSLERTHPISGAKARTIEKMDSVLNDDRQTACRLDCAMRHPDPASVVYNLWPLEGRPVKVNANGAYLGQYTVTNGRIELPALLGDIVIGIPYQGRLQSLPLALESRNIGAYGQGHKKNVNYAILRLEHTAGIKIGPNLEDLREQTPLFDDDGNPLSRSGEHEITMDPNWQDEAFVHIVVDDPFPAKVLSMALDVEVSS